MFICIYFTTTAVALPRGSHGFYFAFAMSMNKNPHHLSAKAKHIKHKFVPRWSLLALFVLGKLCRVRKRVYVSRSKTWGIIGTIV